MVRYGTARQSRPRSTFPKRSKPAPVKRPSKHIVRRRPSRTAKQSGPIVLPPVIAFLGAIALTILVIFLLITAALPNFIQLDRSENIVFLQGTVERDSQAVYFVHLNKDADQSYAAELDPSVSVTAINNYGQYPLGSLSPLLTIDNKDETFAGALYSHVLGVPISKIVRLDSDTAEAQKVQDLFWSAAEQSHASFADKLHLLRRAVYGYNIKTSIESANLSDIEDKMRGKRSVLSNQDAQSCPVAVVNTTNTSGLAQRMGSILESSGALVIRIDSKVEDRPTTVINIQDEESCGAVVERIKELLPVDPTIEHKDTLIQEYRASTVVLLGQDSGQTLAQ